MQRQPNDRPESQISRATWMALAFLLGFLLLLAIVSYFYLLPAIATSYGADETARRHLAVLSLLVLTLVLAALLMMLLLCFRPSRWIFPRGRGTRIRTPHVDAWAESARRMPSPPEEPQEDPPHGPH